SVTSVTCAILLMNSQIHVLHDPLQVTLQSATLGSVPDFSGERARLGRYRRRPRRRPSADGIHGVLLGSSQKSPAQTQGFNTEDAESHREFLPMYKCEAIARQT